MSNSTSLRASRINSSLLALMVVWAATTACEHNTPTAPTVTGPSPKEIEARLLRISEAALVAKTHSGWTARRWESLGAMLPESIGPLRATGAASGHRDTDATKVSKATRNYASTTQTAKVEVMDVVEAGGVLLAFMLQQAAAEVHRGRTANASDEPATTSLDIGPHPALARYTPTTHKSVITVAVGKRFLVELSLTPSTGIDEAVAIARVLPLGAFASVSGVDAPDTPSTTIDSATMERTVLPQ